MSTVAEFRQKKMITFEQADMYIYKLLMEWINVYLEAKKNTKKDMVIQVNIFVPNNNRKWYKHELLLEWMNEWFRNEKKAKRNMVILKMCRVELILNKPGESI